MVVKVSGVLTAELFGVVALFVRYGAVLVGCTFVVEVNACIAELAMSGSEVSGLHVLPFRFSYYFQLTQ